MWTFLNQYFIIIYIFSLVKKCNTQLYAHFLRLMAEVLIDFILTTFEISVSLYTDFFILCQFIALLVNCGILFFYWCWMGNRMTLEVFSHGEFFIQTHSHKPDFFSTLGRQNYELYLHVQLDRCIAQIQEDCCAIHDIQPNARGISFETNLYAELYVFHTGH